MTDRGITNLNKPQYAARLFKKRRWARRDRIILAIIAVLAVVALIGLGVARHIVRRGWPQAEGMLSLLDLREPVTIVRDRFGVPHIFAENDHDLFFAQGYTHAQDRFWQMEFARRRGRGMLTPLLGDAAQSSDEQWKVLNLSDVAARELAEMDAAARATLDAYAAGVNTWLKTQQLPFEFTLLQWRGRAVYEPTRWTAEDSLIVALVLSSQVAAPWIDPPTATQITERVGPERAMLLLGEKRGSNTLVPVSGHSDRPLPQRWALSSQTTLVGGEQTESGKPMLAVDLPTGLDMPAPWYVLAWRLGTDGAAGASVPGLPGLVAGVDDQAVWETWADPPLYAVLSLLKELTPGQDAPPWQRGLLSALFSMGRSIKLIDNQAPRTTDEFEAKQLDTFSARAARLIPLLVEIEPEGWRQERVTGMLRKWDFHIGENNKEAPIFAFIQWELARAAFADELGQDLFEAYGSQSHLYQAALDSILDDPDGAWWDDVTTAERETRDDILRQSYEPALEWLGRSYGDLHMLWEWDIVHGSRLHHALADAWPWDQLLSRDLTPNGWADTIDASPGGLPCTGGVCLGDDIFRAKAVYGYRQILDASEPSTLWYMLLGGQSGHPFHTHYDDLLGYWLAGEYQPLRLATSPEEVDGADTVLVLTPAGMDRD